MTQETAAQNIKNQPQSNTENENKRKPTIGQFCQDFERPSHQWIEENPWCGYVVQT
jgi:hypothetical protein